MKLERIYQAAKKISSLVEEKNYSFSIQSGLECVCMFVSWRGDLLRSRTARVFFSKFIDRCIYRPCQQQNLLALSLSLFVFFFFRANTAKSGAAAAVASRRPLLLPLSFFLLAGLQPTMGGALACRRRRRETSTLGERTLLALSAMSREG